MNIISPLARLVFSAAGVGYSEFLDSFAEALAASGLPPVSAMKVPIGGKSPSKSFHEWRKSVEKSGESSVQLTLGTLNTATVAAVADNKTVNVRLGCSVEDDLKKLPAVLSACAKVVRDLAPKHQITKLSLFRDGMSGFHCFPMPPFVEPSSHAAMVTTADISSGYADEAEFFHAWNEKQQFGDRWLLFRGMDRTNNLDFLRVLLDSQWRLARAAKPGKTRYIDPIVAEHEEGVYRAGEPTLHPTAHVAATSTAEFSCTPPDGEFIRGWEVFFLRDIITKGALDDGRKVSTLRVLFLDRETAEANKRPLLDIGAKVSYPDNTGEPIDIA